MSTLRTPLAFLAVLPAVFLAALLAVLLPAGTLAATEAFEKPKRISGVDWYSTLEGARKAAAPAPKERRKARPILYLRMLGELDGKT